MLNFANAKPASNIMPAGTLVTATLFVEELRASSAGNHYLNVRAEITAPRNYAGRKVWMNLMLTQASGAEPSDVGYAQIKATLEANGNDAESNPSAFEFEDFAAVATAIHGSRAELKLGVEDMTGGGQKNNVKMFISPNPASGTRQLHEQLMSSISEEPTAWPPISVVDSFDAMLAEVSQPLDNPPL
ncbi:MULTISPECIES: hypothetical protein [unclassified Yoonia]|uniref:hypothetical protein n=1 Tax=unclassified Yoonia TaxID=2629118 RepID=UPI002AFEC304|nr:MULTISPECIES: hypothetical protein [unclassified Yoonia]